MNCDECKEQVLDLIDRERTDPEGVREILARCPDCRALFEEAQATLAWAAALPLEEPPRELDHAVLEAARVHAARVVPIERAKFRPVPWAAAAVALLAISVGVWSIPETSDVPSREAERESTAFGVEADAVPTEAAEIAQVEEAAVPADSALRLNREIAPKAARSEAVEGKRRQKRASTARGAGPSEDAMGASADAGFAADAERSAAPVADAPAPELEAGRKEASVLSRKCERRLVEIEDSKDEATGEDALFLGRCYRDARDFGQARRWFERAALDPKTRQEASAALESLPVE